MTDIIWGSTRKPVASQQLALAIERSFTGPGFLYVGYPVLSSAEGVNSIDALWISPDHGLVIFHVVEAKDVEGYDETQDEYANNFETKLRPHKSLMRGRTLLASPTVITYAPLSRSQDAVPGYALATDHNLVTILQGITWDHPDLYQVAHSVVQSISSIRKGRRSRKAVKADSKGSVLKALEDSVANLDSIQSRAVIETVEGVQRIRGLAGSGKTIILALKAAYLHAQHPEWAIAVTFNTRSLKGQFQRLIETFVVEQTGEPPDWTKLQILNAWGAPGGAARTGVYYQFCQENGVEFLDFRTARMRFGRGEEFNRVCELALAQSTKFTPMYDAVLVDEAQDFDGNFLRLCYLSLQKPKRLVYAYDELQSLTEASLPPPEDLFGRNADGAPIVSFSASKAGEATQDVILEKCYRNSRPVLATAHALGFGIYRDVDPKLGTGLIQMFDRPELWEDVGYAVTSGALRDGSQVTLARTSQSSPDFLEAPSSVAPLIEFVIFKDELEQAEWLANEIEANLLHQELSHSDMIVINPDPITTIKQVGLPRKILYNKGIASHVAGVDTDGDVFFKTDEESVAFTGIFRAKGNEAGMVYIMNAQDCYGQFGVLLRPRNQLFTAITRSKAWVRILGIGPLMLKLKEEFTRIVDHEYTLEFNYPDERTRKSLKVINRDLSSEERRKIKGASARVRDLAAELESGALMIDDLPREELDRLRKLIEKKISDGNA